METTGCGVVRGVAIVLAGTVLTITVLIMARRQRRPAWLLPAFVGAMLSAVSLAALLSVMGLVRIAQSILVTGAGGLAAVAQGLWDANQTWRIGLYVSLIAAVVLTLKYFLHPRGGATENWAPRPILVFLFSSVPLASLAISFVTFHGLNKSLISAGQAGMVQPGPTDALVTSRGWVIAIAAIIAVTFSVINVPLSLAFRKTGTTSPVVQRIAGALLGVAGLFVLIALTVLIAFHRSMMALAAHG